MIVDNLKKAVYLLMSTLCFLTACSDNNDDSESLNVVTDFVKGADVSWITQMEQQWYCVLKNKLGEPTDCFRLMKDYGLTAIRLRVWVNPEDGWCNKEDLLAKAKRASAEGLDLMIDFHYSDNFADPSKQKIPAAWEGHSYEELKVDVRNHTLEVLQILKDNHIIPKWVQVGNELDHGFLWNVGNMDINPAQYAGLFAAGYNAVKEVCPETIVIVHLASGQHNPLYNKNLDALKNNGAKWDMVGLSLYPIYAGKTEEEAIDKCIDNMKKVSTKYNCDVMVVETGMLCAENKKVASDAVLLNGKRLLSYFIKQCRENTNGRCKGIFYWEPQSPTWLYNLGAFTEDGYPTIIMDGFFE